MATADLDPSVKFLAKVSKGTKGIVDVNVAQQALGMMPGWSMEPTAVLLEVWRISMGDEVPLYIGPKIGLEEPDATRERNGYVSRRYKDDTWFTFRRDYDRERDKELKTMHVHARTGERAYQIYNGIMRHAHIVDAPPSNPEIGEIYVSGVSAPTGGERERASRVAGTEFAVKQMWLAVPGWRVTAVDGASELVHGPFQGYNGVVQGPVFDNLVGFWSFLYKHGGKADAKAALDAQGSETLEQASMTKEQRERVMRARLFLPEIGQLFNELTQARYEEVVIYLTKQYIGEAKFYIANQNLPYRDRPQLTRVIMDMTERPKQHGDDDLRLKKDHESIAEKHARDDAEEARRDFVWKNTDRISTLARRKGETPTATVIDEREEGVSGYGGNILFQFSDGSSFELRNKTVWKHAPVSGRLFAQFPTTFHNVKLPGGKKMSSPSEQRMLDVFAPRTGKSLEENPALVDDATGLTDYYMRMAQRLARS